VGFRGLEQVLDSPKAHPPESPKSRTPRLSVRGYAGLRRKRTVMDVQRLFSMFPQGMPGVALILLRVSVALTVLLHGYARQDALPVSLFIAEHLLAAMIVVGCFTPILALLAISVQFIGPLEALLSDAGMGVVAALNALALAMLGPGAYSLDALRFGRRVVDVSSSNDE
jgi:hypothetical protein